MTKAARRHRPITTHHRRPHPPAKPKLKVNKPALILALVAVLAAIPFCMGKYIEFGTPGAFDSGSNVYSAKHILEGARIGIEERPSAGLGTLLVNILGVWIFGFSEIGPKVIQTILQAAALIVMFVTLRRLFGTLAAAVGVIVASVYLSAPLIAKAGNVKDQFAIAMMVLGVSCFVLQQLGCRWWLAVLAGAFLAWAPLFKETGYSAAGAIGLFVIAQPIFRRTAWKRTGIDAGMLFAGAALSMAPLLIWLWTCHPNSRLPHDHAFRTLFSVFSSSSTNAEPISATAETDPNTVEKEPDKESFWLRLLPKGYIRGSWMALTPKDKKEMALRIIRYYWLLMLPIALAGGAIVARLIRMIMRRMGKLRPENVKSYEKFVLLFGVWWLLDMFFIWGSPRSYEQYYLPLNTSAAMLGGYLVAIYHDKAKTDAFKPKWVAIGSLGLLMMIIMSWHIFFGIRKSPHSGAIYRSPSTGLPRRDRGYSQRLRAVHARRASGKKIGWEAAGEYIRDHSAPSDGIYVWGWVPGIYVAAQRLSPAPKAFEGTMHTLSPEGLSERVDEILTAFKKQPPKFIVDSRKVHFPWDRPRLELWPIVRYRGAKGETFLSLDEKMIADYDKGWSEILRQGPGGQDEADRFKAMAPFRKFVRENYELAEPRQYGLTADGKLVHRMFDEHVVFKRKEP